MNPNHDELGRFASGPGMQKALKSTPKTERDKQAYAVLNSINTNRQMSKAHGSSAEALIKSLSQDQVQNALRYGIKVSGREASSIVVESQRKRAADYSFRFKSRYGREATAEDLKRAGF